VQEYGAELTSITLRRGPCFGSCPMYEVTLRADGTATWDGERFVDRLGHYEGQVDANDYERLARFIQRAGFFGWKLEYLGDVTDLPDYVLTVVAGNKTKTVRQNGVDEPPDFWVIAALVDHLAEAVDWAATTTQPEGSCYDWTAVHDHQPRARRSYGCTAPAGSTPPATRWSFAAVSRKDSIRVTYCWTASCIPQPARSRRS
jgi:hypothetical protein